MDAIRNRVAESPLKTIYLNDLLPKYSRASLDVSLFLESGILLREKAFREGISAYDWEQFSGKQVAVFCSTDALIPMWAWMLVSSYLQVVAMGIQYATPEAQEAIIIQQAVQLFDVSPYQNERVIIQGCSGASFSPSIFIKLTEKLIPVVQSLMFGEPCSTVPVYKRKS